MLARIAPTRRRGRTRCRLTAPFLLAGLLLAAPTAPAAEIGIYWDEALTENFAAVPEPPAVVNGHIVIHPDGSGGGLLAWECAVGIDGPASATAWDLLGQAVNAAAPPEFAVGLATPLPWQTATVVATFDLLVTDSPGVDVSLTPIRFPSLPDRMAYIDGDAPDVLQPLATTTGGPVVATVNQATGYNCGTDWVHVVYFGPVEVGMSLTRQIPVESCGGFRQLDLYLDCADPAVALTGLSGTVIVPDSSYVLIDVTYTPTDASAITDCKLHIDRGVFYPVFGYGVDPVGTAAPTPLVVQQDGRIDLAWTARAEFGDGYHVFRGGGAGGEVRLTDTPLPVTGETVRFSDRPALPPGTELRYWYTIVSGGSEIARSPAVDVTLGGVPRPTSRLVAGVPNPFNPQTEIRFTVGRAGPVRLDVYDATGRHVRTLVDADLPAGERRTTWRGRDDAGRAVASGTYTVRLRTPTGADRMKLTLLK